ncbi:hypothetical protein ACI3KT_01095 [Microbacterium sp. ZW T6_19]|uniref:hypothetical protein n=1 Tax=Microbacterium sp. ZW T6_19 TaxID=3378082 RepID=UPI0038553BFE
MAQIQAYANGAMRVNPSTGRECLIDAAILKALKTVVVDKNFSISISSLNRYCTNEQVGTGTASYHYRDGGGHAVDINRVNGVTATGSTPQDLALINAMFSALPAPAGLGQIGCGGRNVTVPSGWVQFKDGCNHNHFEYRGGPISVPIEDLDRSFSIATDGTLQAKTGMYQPIVNLRTDIVALDVDGTTTAAVDTAGNVWVQQGAFDSGWVGLAGGAKDVEVDGERFVVLKTDGTVIAKDGLYSTAWTTQLSGVDKIDADGGRLGVLKGGHLFVKEGNLWASWVDQGGGMTDFDLDGNRVGVISGGTAFVKEGDLYASWVTMRNGSRVELEGTRVAVLTPEGIVTVKEGNLWASWADLTGPGVSDFDLAGSRVAVVSGGSVLIKSGPLNAGWIGAYSNSKGVKLS